MCCCYVVEEADVGTAFVRNLWGIELWMEGCDDTNRNDDISPIYTNENTRVRYLRVFSV